MTFYEEMVEAEKQQAAALEAFEKRCVAFVPWLLQRICNSLGWPIEQFKRVNVSDRPEGSRPTPEGYVDGKGYVFAFQVDMWGRWAADFKCSVAACNDDRFTVSLCDRSFLVVEHNEDSLTDIIRHVRDTILDAGRKSNLVEVISSRVSPPQGPFGE